MDERDLNTLKLKKQIKKKEKLQNRQKNINSNKTEN